MRARSRHAEADPAAARRREEQRSRPPATRPYLLPWLALAVIGGVVLVAFGVQPRQVVVYGAYELAYVVAPGCLALIALTRPARLGVRELAIGWALGYALEIAAFVATAALGVRGAFALYPLLVLVAALPRSWPLARALAARARTAARAPAAGSWAWGAVAVALVALAYYVETFLVLTPLPGSVDVLSWGQDVTWQLSVAAETLHHWPVQWPDFYGEPLRYHLWSTTHMAAVAQVTGLPVYLVGLRLVVVPQLLLVVLGFVAISRALGGAHWGGVLGAGLVAMMGFVDPGPQIPGALLVAEFQSASWLLGLAVFLPLVALVVEHLRTPVRWGPGGWIVLAGLLFVAGAAKSSTLPVVAGGLGAVAALGLVLRRPYWRAALAMAALTAIVFALEYALLLSSDDNGLLEWAPLRDIARSQPLNLLGELPLWLAIPAGALAGALVFLKLFAGLLPGLVVAGRHRELRTPAYGFLVAMAVAGFLPVLAYSSPGEGQLYFVYYGWAALAALSGAGLLVLVRGAIAAGRLSRGAVIALVCLAAGIWLVEGPLNHTTKATWAFIGGADVHPTTNDNLTRELHHNLRWISANTPTDAVFTINTHDQDTTRSDPRWCYFTALAERRVWVGCSISGTFSVYPGGPQRRATNDRIYDPGDRRALQAAVDDGISYVAVDLVHGAKPNRMLRGAGRVVFESASLVVFDVRRLRGAGS